MEHAENKEILKDIILKTWKDPSFKSELLSNPVEAIEKHFHVKVNLPAGKKMVIIDQSKKETIYINIPSEPSLEHFELSEEQLEQIAGGKKLSFTWMMGRVLKRKIDSIKII